MGKKKDTLKNALPVAGAAVDVASGGMTGGLGGLLGGVASLFIGGPNGSPLLVDLCRPLNKAITAPSQILRAAHEVVDFIPEGREDILRELDAFRADDAPFAMRLFTGEGGAGKTRLFIQLGKTLTGTGWQYGFLTSEDKDLSPDAMRYLLNEHPRVFIVIDYAENRKPALLALLRQIDSIVHTNPDKNLRIRVALIARAGGDWWNNLSKEDGQLQHLFLPALPPTAVPPLARDTTGSARIFTAALHGYGTHLGLAVPDTATAPPLQATKGNALLIQMAALLALHGKTVENETEILDGVLEHEDRYWQGKAKDATLGKDLYPAVAQALALATLAGGCVDEKQARALIATAPEMIGDAKDARTIAALLHHLYQIRDWLNGVEPDILGEHLVEREASRDLALLDAFFTTADSPHAVHGLIVLVRLMSRKPTAGLELLAPVLDRHGKRLLQYVSDGTNLDLLLELVVHLPHSTTALRAMAARVTQTLLDGVKKMPGDADINRQAAIAHLANNLSVRLSNLGQFKAALNAISEAVDIYRTLTALDADAFISYLARALHNQAVNFDDCGQLEEAIDAINEAINIRRNLVAQHGDTYIPKLAGSFNQ